MKLMNKRTSEISTMPSVAAGAGIDDAVAILKRDGAELDAFFRKILSAPSDAPKKLLEAIEYSLMAGGKRLRPALVMESFRACGGDRSRNASALSAAGAIELIHTFSLVHDDLPAMDDDDLRRGRPTNHKVFGEAMAILAGDAMVTMAFELIATHADPKLVAPLVRELAAGAGPAGMIGGQVLDMDGERRAQSLDELRQIHRMKTGALLTGSCRLGAIAAGADEKSLALITDFGRHMGQAFQIIDDVLDVTSTPEQLGKRTQKDADKGKNTYPALLGLEKSRAEAEHHMNAALAAVGNLGASAKALRTLAHFVVQRHK
jgi:geranylgeranyl diphosphate synthase type II